MATKQRRGSSTSTEGAMPVTSHMPLPDVIVDPDIYHLLQAAEVVRIPVGRRVPSVAIRKEGGQPVKLDKESVAMLTCGWGVLAAVHKLTRHHVPKDKFPRPPYERKLSAGVVVVPATRKAMWDTVEEVLRDDLGLDIPQTRKELLLLGDPVDAAELIQQANILYIGQREARKKMSGAVPRTGLKPKPKKAVGESQQLSDVGTNSSMQETASTSSSTKRDKSKSPPAQRTISQAPMRHSMEKESAMRRKTQADMAALIQAQQTQQQYIQAALSSVVAQQQSQAHLMTQMTEMANVNAAHSIIEKMAGGSPSQSVLVPGLPASPQLQAKQQPLPQQQPVVVLAQPVKRRGSVSPLSHHSLVSQEEPHVASMSHTPIGSVRKLEPLGQDSIHPPPLYHSAGGGVGGGPVVDSRHVHQSLDAALEATSFAKKTGGGKTLRQQAVPTFDRRGSDKTSPQFARQQQRDQSPDSSAHSHDDIHHQRRMSDQQGPSPTRGLRNGNSMPALLPEELDAYLDSVVSIKRGKAGKLVASSGQPFDRHRAKYGQPGQLSLHQQHQQQMSQLPRYGRSSSLLSANEATDPGVVYSTVSPEEAQRVRMKYRLADKRGMLDSSMLLLATWLRYMRSSRIADTRRRYRTQCGRLIATFLEFRWHLRRRRAIGMQLRPEGDGSDRATGCERCWPIVLSLRQRLVRDPTLSDTRVAKYASLCCQTCARVCKSRLAYNSQNSMGHQKSEVSSSIAAIQRSRRATAVPARYEGFSQRRESGPKSEESDSD